METIEEEDSTHSLTLASRANVAQEPKKRRKRKEERGDMQKPLDDLKKDNQRLQSKLDETQRLLRES